MSYRDRRDYFVQYRARKAGRAVTFVRPEGPTTVEHGTVSGYRRCYQEFRRGIRPKTCQPCRDAWRNHVNERRGIVRAVGREKFDPQPVPNGPACTAPGVDSEWFFSVLPDEAPELDRVQLKARNESAKRKALRVCGVCEIREQCLKDNLDMEVGIVGGTTELQRKRLRIQDSNAGPIFLEAM